MLPMASMLLMLSFRRSGGDQQALQLGGQFMVVKLFKGFFCFKLF